MIVVFLQNVKNDDAGSADFHFAIPNEISCKEEETLLKTVRLVTGDTGRPAKLTDNFFDIGGNSLNAVFAVTKLRDQGFDLGTYLIYIFLVSVLLF